MSIRGTRLRPFLLSCLIHRAAENGGLLGNQTAPSKLYLSKLYLSKLYLLLLLAHHQDWAVGMPNYRIRNPSQKGPSYSTYSPASHNHNTGV
jgi:hypothetical protein